jgi:hypothetical protein
MARFVDSVACRERPQVGYLVKVRCGKDRDCLPSDEVIKRRFSTLVCEVLNWNAKAPTRFGEIWDASGSRRLAKITSSQAFSTGLGACVSPRRPRNVDVVGPPDSRYTITVPGLSDVIRLPGTDSPRLRYERYKRWQSSNSPLPQSLRPLVRILNKLDDAQDLLFTAIALARPLIRLIGPRIIPVLGWVLTVNDALNLMG